MTDDMRRALILRDGTTYEGAVRDLKKGDIFSLTEADGTPVCDRETHSNYYVAETDAYEVDGQWKVDTRVVAWPSGFSGITSNTPIEVVDEIIEKLRSLREQLQEKEVP